MIIDRDNNPSRNLYYLGALVIEILKESPGDNIDLFDTFQKILEREKISMKLFVLTLDWLYILGVVELKSGGIRKCF